MVLMDLMHIRGKVLSKRIALGSKSERNAFVLQNADGEFVLRKKGVNSFSRDVEFQSVVGQEIDVEGKILDYLLLVDSWKPTF